MFKNLGDLEQQIVALKIEGEITRKDEEKIHRLMDQSIAKYGSIKLLIMLEHYSSFSSAEALYEDLKFAHLYSDSIERMAVVGDRDFKNTWVAIFGLFSGLITQYFDKSQINDALRWIRKT